MRLLLVDDERRFVDTLTKRLRLRGVEADCAHSGEDALRLASEREYDLALLDVKMPGLGGIELRRRLEELDPGMRFLFVTGHASEQDLAVGTAEASGYLVKPIDIEDLLEAVRAARDDTRKGDDA